MKEDIPLQLNEEIKPIQGYEGLYSITSFGRVWSHKRLDSLGRKCGGKFLKLKCKLDKKRTYFSIILSKKGSYKTYQIHILVAIHFISNPYNLPEVNHKDGNKFNNYKGNLEWSSSQENHNHALINKLKYKKTSKYYGVCFIKDIMRRNKPWLVGVKINKKRMHIGYYKSEIEAAQAYNNYVIEHNLNRPLNNIK